MALHAQAARRRLSGVTSRSGTAIRLSPQERLFELHVPALRGRPGTEGFLGHVMTGWLEPRTAAIAQDGTDPGPRPQPRG